jgi:hypothetical protein
LRAAYADFLGELDSIRKEQNQLLADVMTRIDREELERIHQELKQLSPEI